MNRTPLHSFFLLVGSFRILFWVRHGGSDTPKLYRFGAKVDMCFSMLVKRRVTVRKCYPNCYPFLCHLLSVVFLSVISLTACTHWLITSCILFGLLLARLSALEYWPCLSGRPSLEPNMEPACSNRCSQRPRMRRWWHNRSKKKLPTGYWQTSTADATCLPKENAICLHSQG